MVYDEVYIEVDNGFNDAWLEINAYIEDLFEYSKELKLRKQIISDADKRTDCSQQTQKRNGRNIYIIGKYVDACDALTVGGLLFLYKRVK